ncbi:NAD(P)-binding domain-containing protein [Frigidibacter sp. ROC022]|uniref:NAD(P)-binding domain-containing protein n=1 Tax=Frigidibacter sp. ROC022 TaxID=2971796 RepID=UPI00215A27C3|nr:NAD(P)-binding domain-containing protein [Frigidibacter sp. ROC022]MCR8726024.1 NAD(P)-binding domain-containing protein [Frigidibacter sp. ROC022]
MTDLSNLPIAVIGAGPVGLAAAAELLERGMTPLIFERGNSAGAAVAEWGHVRVFSPWEYNTNAAARRLLEPTGWTLPDPDYLPTGAELIRDYLAPLAAHPAIAPHLHLNAEVQAVTRQGRSKLASDGRDAAPFVILWQDAEGRHRSLARAVIDASGTWVKPNPIGLDGLPVEGEQENAGRIAYGIPDVLGRARDTYAGRHSLVIGAGHSAINAALDLMELQAQVPGTQITWATRSGGIERVLGGGLNDELPGRGQLGLKAAEAIRSGRVSFRSPFAVDAIAARGGGLSVTGTEADQPVSFSVDRIIVATGFRPDLSILSELRLSLDPIVEATPMLAPLIDPNLHSCGTVRPHGVVELSQPEKDFYIVGMKSYGRAPTFLMTTGYEQVRSVVAELAGDPVAAREVRLKLPESGVCKTGSASKATACCGTTEAPADTAETGCCGGAPKADATACCAQDEEAKAAGQSGCGCGIRAETEPAE